MPEAVVVYPHRSRGARSAAEAIARGLAGGGRILPTVVDVEELSRDRIEGADLVVLGVPASAPAATRELRRLERLLPLERLDRKLVTVFDTGPVAARGVGARTVRLLLLHDDPALRLAAPGISVRMAVGSRRLGEAERSRCGQFGAHLARIAAANGVG